MTNARLQDPEISVVIPCRNEEDNVEAISRAVIEQIEPLVESFEIIFIDNVSEDRTVPIIRTICARDPRVRLIINTRNFGQMRSPSHAVFQASGRAVIGLCADFQDSPDLLPEFIRLWRSGASIVLGVREQEKSSFLLTLMRSLSYRILRHIADYPIIPNATGFGLYDRRVVEEIRSLNEPEPFFRGLLVETGFPIETLTYRRPPRTRGKSNNNFFTLLDFAINGLAGSSKGLLRVPLYLSFFVALASLISFMGAIVAFGIGRSWQLWLFAALLEAQFGLLFLFFGLLGVQVALISERSRNQPLVIERERINFSDPE